MFLNCIKLKKINLKNLKKIIIFIIVNNITSNSFSIFNINYFRSKNKDNVDDTFLFIFRSFINYKFLKVILLKKFKKFFAVFRCIFYYYLQQLIFTFHFLMNFKRTDYPGKEISNLVQRTMG